MFTSVTSIRTDVRHVLRQMFRLSPLVDVHRLLIPKQSPGSTQVLEGISRLLRIFCYSQRNTFAESAVHTMNPRTRATMSRACVHHASPFQIPSSSETA
jgi:hypothetical protein